jgi:hypothetical protein
MEKRADSPLISRLVRKSSVDGKAFSKLICGLCSGSEFFRPKRNVFEDFNAGMGGASESMDGLLTPVSASLPFLFVFQRFIMTILVQEWEWGRWGS